MDRQEITVLVGVRQGVIDLVKVFKDKNEAEENLKFLQTSYHPEEDELKIFVCKIT